MLAWASCRARPCSAALAVPPTWAFRLLSTRGAASKALRPPGLGSRVGWVVSTSMGPRSTVFVGETTWRTQ